VKQNIDRVWSQIKFDEEGLLLLLIVVIIICASVPQCLVLCSLFRDASLVRYPVSNFFFGVEERRRA
jgi:accessory gene regulator protein AgrB